MNGGSSLREFESLFAKQYPRIVAILRRIVGDRGRAEDLASEVFLKLYTRPLTHDSDTNVGGWLYRTATNLGIDALRASRRRDSFEHAAARDNSYNKIAENGFEQTVRLERAQRVRSVLAEMKPAQAQLLLLRASDHSYRELAACLDLEPGSVGTLLVRAEAEFERRYLELFGAEEDL
jgi:RNA polymerase sigma-70 factor (ECF subfamily)